MPLSLEGTHTQSKHSHQTMGTETSKTIKFWHHFIYNMQHYNYNVFLLTSFFKWIKATNETTTLLTHFVYNIILY